MKEITTSAATAVPVGSKSKKTEASPEVFSLLMQQLTEQTASNLAASFEPSGMTEQTAAAPEMGVTAVWNICRRSQKSLQQSNNLQRHKRQE